MLRNNSGGKVALRKESVDRNNNQIAVGYGNCLVALRKESVDRNHDVIKVGNALCGRSPQGERG